MDELQPEGVEPVAADTADSDQVEDTTEYTFDEALEALAGDDEQAEAEGEPEAEAATAETITLSDGTAVTLEEVERGFLREADYTRKTTELAEERKALDGLKSNFTESQKRLETNLHNLTEFVVSILPPEPDYALAQTNPAKFVQQQTLRQQAMAELQRVLAVQEDVAATGQAASEAEMTAAKEAEQAKLIKARPELKDPNRLAKFHADVQATAKELGFTEAEVAGTMDARVLQMVDLARIGKIALQNRQNAARRLGAQPAIKGQAAQPAQRQGKPEAVKAFHRNPSLSNALKLDF